MQIPYSVQRKGVHEQMQQKQEEENDGYDTIDAWHPDTDIPSGEKDKKGEDEEDKEGEEARSRSLRALSGDRQAAPLRHPGTKVASDKEDKEDKEGEEASRATSVKKEDEEDAGEKRRIPPPPPPPPKRRKQTKDEKSEDESPRVSPPALPISAGAQCKSAPSSRPGTMLTPELFAELGPPQPPDRLPVGEEWNIPLHRLYERKCALENGVKFKMRGPWGPHQGGPAKWGNQTYRAKSNRWGNRGGVGKQYSAWMFGRGPKPPPKEQRNYPSTEAVAAARVESHENMVKAAYMLRPSVKAADQKFMPPTPKL